MNNNIHFTVYTLNLRVANSYNYILTKFKVYSIPTNTSTSACCAGWLAYFCCVASPAAAAEVAEASKETLIYYT
jgi:hypothetical protein